MSLNFDNVTSLYIEGKEVEQLQIGSNVVWRKPATTDGYLTFTSSSSMSITPSSYWNATLKLYSIDEGVSWNVYTSGSVTGTDIRFKGYGGNILSRHPMYVEAIRWRIESASDVYASGNIENLLDCHLVTLGQHPTMGSHCCMNMFYGCTSLVSAPELPATTVPDGCYSSMFYGCTSLTTAPALPATTLASDCYQAMFYGCTSLTTAPSVLPAISFEEGGCYHEMFAGCSSLISSPRILATSLNWYLCQGMFWGCTSLTTIPELLATMMPNRCYCEMFGNCTALKFSETQTTDCPNAYRIPSSGTGSAYDEWNRDMFLGTSGTFTSNPTINTTYYTNATVV